MSKVVNFGAGPAKLPKKVLLDIQQELLDHSGTGISILEMSHRSEEFSKVIKSTEKHLRDLLEIPENYCVLFMQGGASLHFSAVPLNLFALNKEKTSADYLVTGVWSAKAAVEATKFGHVREVFPKTSTYQNIPDETSWELNPQAAYLYYCDNETVHGVEFPTIPTPPPGVPLVCDMSSNFMSRPVDVRRYGIIFAGAQKNVGCAGVTIVIVRRDLIPQTPNTIPLMLDYKTQADNNSMYNTPPTFGIYVTDLVMNWTRGKGGLKVMAARSQQKSGMLYDFMDRSNGFYHCPVERHCRSRMNIVFRILSGDESVEKLFVKAAQVRGFLQLEGHRSVGGLRASIYNAVKIREVQELVDFMKEFQQEHVKPILCQGDVVANGSH